MTPGEIINEIERLRIEAGLTQAQLAARIGLSSQQSWSHYARGKATSISIDMIVRALAVFGQSLEIRDGARRAEVTDSANNRIGTGEDR
jgi:transcriptional regulator with XRE-family HTH domain